MPRSPMLPEGSPDAPWMPRADEDGLTYRRFRIFVGRGPKRSTARLRLALAKQHDVVNVKQLEKQSAQYDWVDRARAADLRIERDLMDQQSHDAREAHSLLLDASITFIRALQENVKRLRKDQRR